MNKNIILFHELNESIVNSVLEMINDENHKHHKLIMNSDFTFDDGLYSQYKFIPQLMVMSGIQFTVLVSSEFVYNGTSNQVLDIIAPQAHEFARNGDLTPYCTVKNMKELIRLGVKIGNHGANHLDFYDKHYSIRDVKNMVQNEVERSTKFFNDNNIITDSFAYPYNKVVPFYELLLKREGVVNFYGKERININTLI